jgi:hypothetical protein
MTQTTKRCTICGKTKPIDQFHRKYKDPAKPDHRNSHCIDCNKDYQKKYQARNAERLKQKRDARVWTEEEIAAKREYNRQRYHNDKDVYRKSRLPRLYGLTTDEYYDLLAFQSGVCMVCSKKCKSGRALAVDHDHKTGKIRGLLCASCNQGIGHLKDDPELCALAADYLLGRLMPLRKDDVNVECDEYSNP